MEEHFYGKQRLWGQFLASCDCDDETCPDPFNLSMMHGSLYDRLMADSKQGNLSVVKHLLWQPHKVAAAYPWRLRMYAHMALVLPRSLALLHSWRLAASEDLALALQHVSQGVPLVLDPDSPAGQRVEPDASILCKLAPPDAKPGSKAEERSPEVSLEHPPGPGNGTSEQQPEQQPEQDGEGLLDSSESGDDDDGGSSGDGPGGDGSSNSSSSDAAGGGGGWGGKRRRRAAAAEGPEEEAKLRRFVCTLYDARGAAPLLRLLSPEQLAEAMAGHPQEGSDAQRGGAPPPALPHLPPPSAALPPPRGAQGVSDGGGTSNGSGGGSGVGEGVCSSSLYGDKGNDGSCTAPAECEAAAAGEEEAAPAAAGSGAGGGGEAPAADAGHAGGGAAGGGGKPGDSGGKDRAGRSDAGANGRGGGICRNSIFVRPPRQSEVSEHVREMEASPLGLSPLELLRVSLPRMVELTGWLVLPHVMMGRYVMLLAPPAVAEAAAAGAGDGAAAGGGGAAGTHGGGAYDDQLRPMLSVGLVLTLVAGVLLTTVELLLWARVFAELMSLSRPGRSWARRREAAWRVFYEGMVQPLREALLSWNITHFVMLPLLQLVLSMPALDIGMLLAVMHCVLVLGVTTKDVAARATPALLRVARRARQHEGGYALLLVNVVAAVEPQALPYVARTVQWFVVFDVVGHTGRAAVLAAILAEAPGLVAALAAAAVRRGGGAAAAAGGAGDPGGGGELAAAMQARVAAAVDPQGRRGGGAAGEGLYDSEDEGDEEEAEEGGREGRPVVLRWPAPLQLPPEAHDWEDVPRGFTCAITQQLMVQPAMLVSPDLPAAPTYERSAIQQWLAGQMRDPKSNTPLRSYSLLPNEDLHRAIDDWVAHRLRDGQRRPRRSGRTKRRPTGRQHDAGAVEGAEAAGADAGLLSAAAVAVAVVGVAGFGDGDANNDGGGGGVSASYSGDESDSYNTQSPSRSASVLASLAHGASSLMDTGVEVMSRAAAAATAAAVAVAAATAGGGLMLRDPSRPDGAGPSGAAPGQEGRGGRDEDGDPRGRDSSDGAAARR